MSADGDTSLVSAYPMEERSLLLRLMCGGCFGSSCVWVPRMPDTFHEMLPVIKEATAFLGFREYQLQSTASATCYCSITCSAPQISFESLLQTGDESHLSLLWVRPPELRWRQLCNFLVYRQSDVQHECITNKWKMTRYLLSADSRLRLRTGSGKVLSSNLFLPFSVRMDTPVDQLQMQLAEQPGMYILKAVRGSRGENLHLLRCGDDIEPLRDLLRCLQECRLKQTKLGDVILQKYIESPLLVDKRKFDLRVYLLVVNARRRCPGDENRPERATLAFCHPGFVRLCMLPYNPTACASAGHLTNQHVQMQHPMWEQLGQATVWLPDELNDYCNRRRLAPGSDFVKDFLYPRVFAVVGYLAAAFSQSLGDPCIPSNTFKVMGVDFIVDNSFTAQLLEVNELPSWKRQLPQLEQLKCSLWQEALAVAVETVAKFRLRQPLLPLRSACNFRLVHSTQHPDVLREAVAANFD